MAFPPVRYNYCTVTHALFKGLRYTVSQTHMETNCCFFCFCKSGQKQKANKIYSILNERCSDPRDKHTNLNRSPTTTKKQTFQSKSCKSMCQLGPKQVSMGMKWQPLIGWMKRRLASEPKNMRRLGKFTVPFVLEYTQTRGAS